MSRRKRQANEKKSHENRKSWKARIWIRSLRCSSVNVISKQCEQIG